MRKCPCCGGLLFNDMDRCYECMHPMPAQNHEEPRERSAPNGSNLMLDLSDFGDVSGMSLDEAVWNGDHAREAGKPEVEADDGDAQGDEVAPGEGAATAWELTVRIPGAEERSLLVSGAGSEVRIGRSGDNDIGVSDPRVSRHHALIFESEGRLWVRDLGSRNMTFLSGFPVVGTMLLGDGAKLGIGGATITAQRLRIDEVDGQVIPR